mgnify:CR=1 FL=1
MIYTLLMTIVLSTGNTVTSEEVGSLEVCHLKGKAWLASQLQSVEEINFAITYNCEPSRII